jgi:hypothetical protein
MNIEGENIHCLGIACTRPFYMGLASAEGQKLGCFNVTTNNILMSTIKICNPIYK